MRLAYCAVCMPCVTQGHYITEETMPHRRLVSGVGANYGKQRATAPGRTRDKSRHLQDIPSESHLRSRDMAFFDISHNCDCGPHRAWADSPIEKPDLGLLAALIPSISHDITRHALPCGLLGIMNTHTPPAAESCQRPGTVRTPRLLRCQRSATRQSP